MIIGIPKEIKESEHRVGMTPSGVQTLIQNGHDVYVQNSAGQGSGHSDEDYSNVGANLLKTIEEIYDISEMIIKVKEPLKKEYSLIKEGQIIYTYFHFASSLELTKAMIDSKSKPLFSSKGPIEIISPILVDFNFFLLTTKIFLNCK